MVWSGGRASLGRGFAYLSLFFSLAMPLFSSVCSLFLAFVLFFFVTLSALSGLCLFLGSLNEEAKSSYFLGWRYGRLARMGMFDASGRCRGDWGYFI